MVIPNLNIGRYIAISTKPTCKIRSMTTQSHG